MTRNQIDFASLDVELAFERLHRAQQVLDSQHWTSPVSGPEKRRHISFHLGIASGKLCRVEERADHGDFDDSVVDDVAADLLVYALQLSELRGKSLAELYERRSRQIQSGSITHRGV